MEAARGGVVTVRWKAMARHREWITWLQVAVLRVLLYAGVLAWLVPLGWMLTTALKPRSEIFLRPPKWVPERMVLDHFQAVLHAWPFLRWTWNSVVIAIMATGLSLVVSSLAAYAFARMRWRGRDAIFYLFLVSMLVPSEVNAVPLYFITHRLGLLNTHLAAVLPVVALPVGTFLLRQFLLSIPRELDDSARVDGCGHVQIFWYIVLPLARPAMAALAIYIFILTWNDFFWPFLALQKANMLTLTIGLKALQGAYDIDYGLLMAGATLASVPVLLAFSMLSRSLIRGISLTGGLK